MRAVIYARYSHDSQREESITAQLRAAQEYCRKKDYVVTNEYVDEAYSAKTDNRPAFQRMIADAKLGLFDVLIVHKMDRFARNRYDAAYYKRILKKANVVIEYVDQPLDGSPESIILESVLEGMAEYYSKNLAREVMKGKKETAYQGRFNGGTPPLGYDVKDGRYVINEKEAAVVRFLFEQYLSGLGLTRIINEANRRGYTTKRGQPFGKNGLYEILHSKRYFGILQFGRATTNEDGSRNTHAKHEDVIEVPGAIPAILPLEWLEPLQKAQAERGLKNHYKRTPEKPYLLSGVLRCTCGASMIGTTSRSGTGKKYHYYICNAKDRKRTCTEGKIPQDKIEAAVLNHLYGELLGPENIERLVDELAKAYAERALNYQSELREAEKEKAGLERDVDRLIDLADTGTRVRERLISEQAKLAKAEFRIKEITARAKATLLEKSAIRRTINDFLEKRKDPEGLRVVIKTLIKSIVVTNGQVHIDYNFSVFYHGAGEGT